MRALLWLLYAGRAEYTVKKGSFNALAVDLLLDDQLKLWVNNFRDQSIAQDIRLPSI